MLVCQNAKTQVLCLCAYITSSSSWANMSCTKSTERLFAVLFLKILHQSVSILLKMIFKSFFLVLPILCSLILANCQVLLTRTSQSVWMNQLLDQQNVTCFCANSSCAYLSMHIIIQTLMCLATSVLQMFIYEVWTLVWLTLLRGAFACTGSSAASAMLLMVMTIRMHISK